MGTLGNVTMHTTYKNTPPAQVLGLNPFITAPTILGVLSIRSLQTSFGIVSHSSCIWSQSSCTPAGVTLYLLSCHLRCCHRCSIGLRLGDSVGHFKTLMLFCLNYSKAFWEVCLGHYPVRWQGLPCPTHKTPVARKSPSGMLVCGSAFILPTILHICPTPWGVMWCQNIRYSCLNLTTPLICCSLRADPGFFHT